MGGPGNNNAISPKNNPPMSGLGAGGLNPAGKGGGMMKTLGAFL
jgi:hypothetical protein